MFMKILYLHWVGHPSTLPISWCDHLSSVSLHVNPLEEQQPPKLTEDDFDAAVHDAEAEQDD